MLKLKTIEFKKIWGKEIWCYSPLGDRKTLTIDNEFIQLNILIKIIITVDNLSIQVHPDDRQAKELENQKNGKSESWFILDSKKDSQIILGIKDYEEKNILKLLDSNNIENSFLKIKPKKNQFFNIPGGLIHGIGKNLTILEVQQPSDITYRIYDYERIENDKKRELHTDKAIKVIKDLPWDLKPIKTNPLTYKNNYSVQIFTNKHLKIDKTGIVVNLETFDSYIVFKDQAIDFNNLNFAYISDN